MQTLRNPMKIQQRTRNGFTGRTRPRRRGGQIMIFFIMVIVLLTFTALWNFDLQKLFRVKSTVQNAGDAAALMAARWQAISLNLAGDLNLMQAIALGTGDADALEAIGNLQARLRFVGPMTAMLAAQQAAKNNGVHVNPEYTAFLREHAVRVARDYPYAVGAGGEMLFPEPYPGAWEDYSRMITVVVDNGVAAAPDNIRLYSDQDTGGHLLYDIGFYEAIAGRNWCWFHFNAPSLLEDYRNFFPVWWDALPEPPRSEMSNSEIFGLGLSLSTRPLVTFGMAREAADVLSSARGLAGVVIEGSMTSSVAWVVYDVNWGSWEAAATDGEDPFPFAGPVRSVYNYAGADAAVRVEATAGRLTPGSGGGTISNTLVWTAAAKPFGYLEGDLIPTAFHLVLPAYRDVRLIPVDTSSAPAGGGFNLAWRRHIEQHLPDYMEDGPFHTPLSCWYCRQLRTWERESFRRSGAGWLRLYSDRCTPSQGGGGGGRGGGRRRGH